MTERRQKCSKEACSPLASHLGAGVPSLKGWRGILLNENHALQRQETETLASVVVKNKSVKRDRK